MTSEDFCIGKAECLLTFVKEIFALDFEEEPPYEKLKFLLTKELLGNGLKPD